MEPSAVDVNLFTDEACESVGTERQVLIGQYLIATLCQEAFRHTLRWDVLKAISSHQEEAFHHR